MITEYATMRNNYNTYLTTFEKTDLSINQAFENQKKSGSKWKALRFNTNTIESLESTGYIKLIPKSIRNKLIELKRFQNRTISLSDIYGVKGGVLCAIGCGYVLKFIPFRKQELKE
jgi:hypothetical protein